MLCRILSIAKKDYIEIKKNTYLFLTACMPIFFSVLIYINAKENVSNIELFLTMSSTYVFSIILVLASTLAEEKEYKTLEALIMSPTSFIEIIVGKSIVPFALGIFNYLVGCNFLLELNLHNQLSNFLIFVLMFIFSILLGILIGLASKNITQVNLIFIPLFTFITLPILYESLTKYNRFFTILKYFPSGQQYGLFINDSNLLLTISVILIWSLLVIALNYYFYKKIIISE